MKLLVRVQAEIDCAQSIEFGFDRSPRERVDFFGEQRDELLRGARREESGVSRAPIRLTSIIRSLQTSQPTTTAYTDRGIRKLTLSLPSILCTMSISAGLSPSPPPPLIPRPRWLAAAPPPDPGWGGCGNSPLDEADVEDEPGGPRYEPILV